MNTLLELHADLQPSEPSTDSTHYSSVSHLNPTCSSVLAWLHWRGLRGTPSTWDDHQNCDQISGSTPRREHGSNHRTSAEHRMVL